ncbi:MAG: AI-2E family transporter [Acetobacteraceae bacterium]|nr:AI-2E family transporter [Acetobacteraceae bacterium]
MKTELGLAEIDGRERRQATARILLALGLVGLGCFILQNFLRPLLWAGVLAIAVAPLYARARRSIGPDRHNLVLPLAFTAATTLIVLVPLVLIGLQLAHEAGGIMGWLQEVRTQGLPPPAWLDRAPLMHDQVISWWQDNLADPEGARALIGRGGRINPLQMGRQVGAALLHRSVDFVFTVVTLFFLFREGPSLGPKLMYAARRLFGPQAEPVARQMVASIHGTVDGLVLVGLGEGLVLGIGYAIVGAPHPALLGFITGIAAVIPGAAPVVIALAAGLVLTAGKTIAAAALLVLGLAFIFIADHTVRPALIGGATKLPFLWVLLGILGGVETFGLLGLFLGPAVMAVLILLWRQWTRDATNDASI